MGIAGADFVRVFWSEELTTFCWSFIFGIVCSFVLPPDKWQQATMLFKWCTKLPSTTLLSSTSTSKYLSSSRRSWWRWSWSWIRTRRRSTNSNHRYWQVSLPRSLLLKANIPRSNLSAKKWGQVSTRYCQLPLTNHSYWLFHVSYQGYTSQFPSGPGV